MKNQNNTLDRELYNVSETLEILGIGRTSFYKAVDMGQISVRKLGKKTLVTKAELKRFVEGLPPLSEKNKTKSPKPKNGSDKSICLAYEKVKLQDAEENQTREINTFFTDTPTLTLDEERVREICLKTFTELMAKAVLSATLQIKKNELEKKEAEKQKYNEALFKPCVELGLDGTPGLSIRTMNCLSNENIKYIAELVVHTEQEMMQIPNFGRKSLNELKESLKFYGLEFGMKNDLTRENIEAYNAGRGMV